MGRSARWQGPEGQEMLAETSADADDELGLRLAAMQARSLTGPPSLRDVVAFAVLLGRIARRALDRRAR
jgi:hypothetical protein